MLDSDDELDEETIVDNQAYARFTLIEGNEARQDEFVTVKDKTKAKTVRVRLCRSLLALPTSHATCNRSQTVVYGCGLLLVILVGTLPSFKAEA